MPPIDAVTLRSLLVCAATLGLAGCTRGCDFGPPAQPCERTDECEAPDVCHRGYCSSPGYVEFDDRCRAAPACRAQGKCGALTVRSFLGADNSLECAAVDDADCKAAEVCAAEGLCTRQDGWCVAETDAECAASQRCRTHEQCSAHGLVCVRRWPTELAPQDPTPGAPAWARPVEVEVDMQRLGDAWQSGTVTAGLLVCRVQLARGGESRVRIGGRHEQGPRFARGGGVETFVRPGVHLQPGDELAVASQFRWEAGASDDSFVKATYSGTSPFHGGAGEETLLCHVVAPATARPLGLEGLAAADRTIADVEGTLAASRARRARPIDLAPAPLDEARRSTSQAAVWLGWSDPEVDARVQKIAAVEEAWSVALAAAFVELRATATPPRTLLALDDVLAIQVLGHVCGADLDARRPAEARRTTAANQCAVEVRLENRSTRDARYSTTWLENLSSVRWLQVRAGRGETIELELIDVRTSDAGAPPGPSVEVAPEAAAIALLGGRDRDLTLPPEGPDDFTLLHARVVRAGETITLRTELVPDPPGADKPRAKRARKR